MMVMKRIIQIALVLWISACQGQNDEQYAFGKQLEKLARDLESNYIFEDKGLEMQELIVSNLNAGKYNELTSMEDLANVLNEELRDLTNDKHLRIRTNDQGQRSSSSPKRRKSYVHGLGESKIMDGNIGYWEITGFVQPNSTIIKEVQENIARLEGTKAIILDFRNNGGGSPDGVRLICSYFFSSEEEILLNSLYFRNRDVKRDFYTITDLQGPYLTTTPLYILTSDYTFSGGEEFCYNMQTQKRATLIGETTGGGAHPVDRFLYKGGLVAIIPVGRAINPITNSNWEGTGVAPEIQVNEEQALEKAIEVIAND